MFSFAEFCAGIGGFRLGLEKLGWNCVFSCEIDPQCEHTYRDNFGHTFHAYDIADICMGGMPAFDVLCAGFPCQPFSIAGKRLGYKDNRGNVLFYLIEIIKFARPSIVFLENVTNFMSHDHGITFQLLKEELAQAGYSTYFTLLDSSFFGVPQQRKRIYIVAFQESFNNKSFVFTKKRTKSTIFRHFIKHNDYSIPISEKWQEYIDLYTGKKTLDQMTFPVPKTRQALERINAGANLDDCVFQLRSSGIRACSIDAPLPTLAVSHSGGGAMIPVYSGERRHLNIAEMKRIMGFPDAYSFPVARTHAIKQLSNAVCPPVIESIGEDIQRYVLTEDYADETSMSLLQTSLNF
ncbi:MAG: DNA (cytosine-5-)-methyltransferase [Candidatus Viridilinea halotolerans]|uniref:Cytosine-specific methyltransferase n=1 Tax=Candidatus Viridilinea halotolerans TaxID=2491704 RepID=A0A426UA09_9CHLR|nr:MAG: DNA (cytosine-5-)-methyltransferase [Candidatus Viridilinea halotolerans]